jgi:predicted nucleotide-binding protein (sugar kinase/HSP70/actin superfamily)
MKIMLTYYNDLTVLLSTVFHALGFNVDYIGRTSRKTIDLGIKHSPESWCFDVKLILGQALEGVERGDNIVCVPGAWGAGNQNCLLGYLTKGIMQKRLEEITGKKMKVWFFNVNPIEMIYSGYTAAYKNLSLLKQYSKVKFFRSVLIRALILGTKKMKMASDFKEEVLSCSDVVNKGELFSIYDHFIRDMIFNADNLKDSKKIFSDAMNRINGLERKKIKKKIVIGLVGDYAHTLFSLFPFFDLEKFLLMENVVVKQPLSFLNYYSFLSPLYAKKNRIESRKLLPQKVSGSDAVTILSSIYLKDKVDGLIHIRTFSCTPEEVANEVLVSNKEKFPPILSLSYDAHTTEENLKVRIEAFIDMLLRKKGQK